MAQKVRSSTECEGLRPTRLLAWRARAAALVGVSAVAAVLVACGTPAAREPVDGSGSSGGSSSTTSTTRPTDVPAPKQWVIDVGDLPQGWRESSPPRGDYRVTLCGVDLEPALAIRAGAWRWSQSALGPFLEQQVRVYGDDQAQEVISALRAALPTCTRTEVPKATNSSETISVTIEPITVAGLGPDSVAWRQTVGSDRPVTSEIVLTRRGRTAVLFNSYAIGTRLDRNVLVQAVAALETTPRS